MVTGKECKVKCVCVCFEMVVDTEMCLYSVEVIQETYQFIMQENKGKIAE